MSPPDDDDDDRTIIRPPSQRAAAAPLGHMLPLGTHLLDYEITGLIGEGGFGIVYLAWDHSLQRKVAIKEYMPASMASRIAGSSAIVVKSERHLDTFKAGLKSFMNEARLLARFDHSALVKVYRFWEENGTAYMAMPFYEGPTLKTALADMGHPPSEAQLRAWLTPLLDALTVMHAAQCFHRDIAPDNILLTQTGPLLLDFGAARRVIGDMTHALTVVLKPGYAPIEQYGDVASMTQGAWTDIYALACVVYYAITGRTPMSSVERLMDDRLEPIAVEAQGRYGDGFLRAIDAALAVRPQDRPQNEAQFRALLDIDQPAPPRLPPLSGYGALSHEPFPATQDGGYSTVPGTLTPELATQLQARTVPPAVTPPAAPPTQLQTAPAPPLPPAEPARRQPAVIATPPPPSPVLPRALPAQAAVPKAPTVVPAPVDPGARNRTLVLGFASLLVVSGLALGVYWTLQPSKDEEAKPAAPTASAVTAPSSVAAPASAAVPAVVPPAPAATPAVVASPTLPAPAAPTLTTPPEPLASAPAATVPRETATTVAPTPAPAPAPAAARPRREPPAESRPAPAAPSAYPPTYAPAYPPAPRPAVGVRCSDILQKASLEPLTAEEAAYLKRECR